MTYVATIYLSDGTNLSFDSFVTDQGRIPDHVQTVEEELTAPGVNGRRFRDVSDLIGGYGAWEQAQQSAA